MIRKSITVIIVVLFAMILDAAAIKWQNNIEEALQNAEAENKYVFVFFTGSDWCTWCHRLKGEVFDYKEFQDYAAENMEMVKLDFPKAEYQSEEQVAYNQRMMKKYGIRGFPSVVILNSNGEKAMQLGYREGGPVKYVEYIDNVLNWSNAVNSETWEDSSGQLWYKNLERAKELATESGKHILVNFTGSDWCTWCHRLRDEVFLEPEFVDFAEENLVLLRFDFPKRTALPAGEENYNTSMAQKFGVRGFPTIFLLNSDGGVLQKLGYEEGGAVPYVAMLSDLIN